MAKVKKNTGIPYERVAQGIFQTMLNRSGVGNVVVEHNKILQGIGTTHQVDGYWELEAAGIIYKTIVQAKDWKTPVKKGQLIELKGVLDDLPGQVRGIFVTRTGYQRGAKEFAEKHGIILYELGEPRRRENATLTTLGWLIAKADLRSFSMPSHDPNVKAVEELAMGIRMQLFNPKFSNVIFEISGPSLREALSGTGLDIGKFKLNTLPFLQTILYDKGHQTVSNLDVIMRHELAVIKGEQATQKHVVHTFENETFLGPEGTGGCFVKVNKVSVDVEIEVTEREPQFKLTKFVQLVLRDLSSDKIESFLAQKVVTP